MECFRPRRLTINGESVTVPCGKCGACLMNRAEDWKTRLRIHQEATSTAYFVTLTYDDEHLPHDEAGNPCFEPEHLKAFHKALRTYIRRGEFICDTPLFGKQRFPLEYRKISYFLTSEYGPDEGHRPHYHGIYFNLPDDEFLADLLVRKCWTFGSIITVEPLTEGRLNYTAEYALNARLAKFAPDDWMPHIFRVSNGIGAALLSLEKTVDWMRSNPTKRVYMPSPGGGKRRLSRYLKGKVFDDDMKARIADEYVKQHPSRYMSCDELCAKIQRNNEYERQLIRRVKQKKLHYV